MLYIQAIQMADAAIEIDNQSRIYGDKFMHEWRKLSFYVLAWSSFAKSSAGMGMTMKDKRAHAFHDVTLYPHVLCQSREMIENANNWDLLSLAKTLSQ